jgi:hypothetical protein
VPKEHLMMVRRVLEGRALVLILKRRVRQSYSWKV